ncbi:MAG: type II toxin-antitoxin system HicB family antitoxin [Planctomycetes bacterium]|nr:type II toxin-antitoxin system HicB family antitoxin [Planctomycetota bacterium]
MGHGIATQGRDLNDLLGNIREACEFHCEEELAAGKTIDLLVTAKLEVNGAAAAAG